LSRHGLALKSAPGGLAQRTIGRKNLDGHVAIQPRVMSEVNHAHATRSKIRENIVVREPSANHGFVPR
jgi:hypothetical protein